MGGALYKKENPRSVKEVVTLVTHSVWVVGGSLFVIFIALTSSLFLRDSHAALCSMVEARLDNISSPLSRELSVSDGDSAARAIFSDFQKSLSNSGVHETLFLRRITQGDAASSSFCQADILGATISYPLTFGGNEIAVIHGTMRRISLFQIAGLSLILLVLLYFIARITVRRLNDTLQETIIAPITALSKNEAPTSERLPKEVEEIQLNLDLLRQDIQKNERAAFELKRTKEINEIAARIIHDIGSPLVVLDKLIGAEGELPEAERRAHLRSIATRLRDTARALVLTKQALQKGDSVASAITSSITVLSLPSAIEDIIFEKRIEFSGRLGLEMSCSLSPDSYGLFARINPSELKSVLSNLINNAAEAIKERGQITVELGASRLGARIEISDTGSGIDSNLLSRLMAEPAHSTKSGGMGYGLYDARKQIEKWGGTIQLESQRGVGTTISIELPIAEPPKWFVPTIELLPATTLVVLDDDPFIHSLWEQKFGELTTEYPTLSLHHFHNVPDFEKWHAVEDGPDVLYLIDHDLRGSSKNGLEIIRELNLCQRAILVTHRAEDDSVKESCINSYTKLLFKRALLRVPVTVHSLTPADVDCVLIDDDHDLRSVWRIDGLRAGKKVQTFESPAKFLAIADKLPREVPIYIDSNLSGVENGESAAKSLYESGFRNIFLTTGLLPEGVEKMYWIKGTLGKSPPWQLRA